MSESVYVISDPQQAYLEVARKLFKQVIRDRHAFNVGMLLPFEVQKSLVEYDSFPFFVGHTNQTLHKILPSTGLAYPSRREMDGAYADFVPKLIITFEHAKMMLYGNDLTVTWNELLLSCTRKVATSPHRDNSSLGWRVVFAITVNTGGKDFLCLRVIYHPAVNFLSQEGPEYSPLIANCLFMASVRIFLRPSFSALSSIYSRSS